jgi:conjugal transfer pilus assembly protein TraW
MKQSVLLISIFFPCVLLAKPQVENLGVWGTTYTIQEKDAIEAIKERVVAMQKNGEMDRIHKEWLDKTKSRVENGPPPVLGLKKAVEDKVWFFDPSIVANQNVSDSDGKLLIKAGTRVNPLQLRGLKYEYLIIDGLSGEQVKWAVKEYKKSSIPIRIVLIAGSPTKLMREYPEIQFFFDQNGRMVERFGLSSIPVHLKQEGQKIKISEIGKLL